jgi:hypothetical protein
VNRPPSSDRTHVDFGLCADCRHAERVSSSKGSLFLLCGLAKSDPRFPKYPRVPVLSCSGYLRTAPESAKENEQGPKSE